MKRIILVYILLFFSVHAFAQKEKDYLDLKSRYGFEVQRLAPVSFNLYVDRQGEKARPLIYISLAIQNDLLQFRQMDDGYEAAYQVNIAIRQEELTFYTESLNEHVRLKTFEETNSRRIIQKKNYIAKSHKFPAAPKTKQRKYQCHLEILDLVSKKAHHLKREFYIKPLSKDSCTFSDIGIFEGTADSAGRPFLLPRRKSLAFNKAYFALSRLYGASAAKAVRVFLKRKEGQVFNEWKTDTIKTVEDSAGLKILYEFPYKDFKEGQYRLIFKYNETQIKKDFEVIWFEKPIYLYKADLALRPLKYVIGEALYDSVRSLPQEKLQKWFRQFWKERDDTPRTEFNELLFEYYKRVDYCNHHFSRRSLEGWETDRGKIYLLYGPPLKIENRRYSANTLPYLIWTYEEGLQFLFVDKKDNGEFILIENEIKE